jgi:hypothetical protein
MTSTRCLAALSTLTKRSRQRSPASSTTKVASRSVCCSSPTCYASCPKPPGQHGSHRARTPETMPGSSERESIKPAASICIPKPAMLSRPWPTHASSLPWCFCRQLTRTFRWARSRRKSMQDQAQPAAQPRFTGTGSPWRSLRQRPVRRCQGTGGTPWQPASRHEQCAGGDRRGRRRAPHLRHHQRRQIRTAR